MVLMCRGSTLVSRYCGRHASGDLIAAASGSYLAVLFAEG
jgi:hypothetical protein